MSSGIVNRSELEDGASASRLCEVGPASGEGSGLAALIVIVAVVACFGVAVGGGRGGTDAVVVELNGVAEIVGCTFDRSGPPPCARRSINLWLRI